MLGFAPHRRRGGSGQSTSAGSARDVRPAARLGPRTGFGSSGSAGYAAPKLPTNPLFAGGFALRQPSSELSATLRRRGSGETRRTRNPKACSSLLQSRAGPSFLVYFRPKLCSSLRRDGEEFFSASPADNRMRLWARARTTSHSCLAASGHLRPRRNRRSPLAYSPVRLRFRRFRRGRIWPHSAAKIRTYSREPSQGCRKTLAPTERTSLPRPAPPLRTRVSRPPSSGLLRFRW